MSLIAHLQQIPEFRAARGQRHELWFVLLLIILGAMMGYWGYRPLAESALELRQRDLPETRTCTRGMTPFLAIKYHIG